MASDGQALEYLDLLEGSGGRECLRRAMRSLTSARHAVVAGLAESRLGKPQKTELQQHSTCQCTSAAAAGNEEEEGEDPSAEKEEEEEEELFSHHEEHRIAGISQLVCLLDCFYAAVYVVHQILLKLVDDLLGWLFATAMLLGPSWLLVFVIAPRTTRSSALLSALVRLDVLLVAEVWDASGRMHDIRTQIRDELLARHSQQPSDTTAAATAGGGGGKKKAEDASILSAPAQRSVVALEPYSSSADPAASPATRTAVSQSAAPSGLLVSKLESGCAASC
jgi:hypothetical protein